MNNDQRIANALAQAWDSSSQLNWIIGLLGKPDGLGGYTIDVPERTGWVFVSLGADGLDGQTIAEDMVGVSPVGFQTLRMRRERGHLVIREAQYTTGGAAGPLTIDDLSDVVITTPADNQFLRYDSGTSKWVNETVSGSPVALGDLSDVTVTAPVISQILRFNGSEWVNSAAGEAHDEATAGDGIVLSGQQIFIDLADSNPGLEFSAGDLQLGTPLPISYITDNTKTGAGHTHAVISSADITEIPNTNNILRGDNGKITLSTLEVKGNINFLGADRSITNTGGSLTISPTADLILSPLSLEAHVDSNVDFRTPSFVDKVTGIMGFNIGHDGGNVRSLTIAKIKADELYVRVFTADEVRITRGEQAWAYSYGIVESPFWLPALGVSVDVWFEESPELGAAAIFVSGDWINIKAINWDGQNGSPMSVMNVWFTVFPHASHYVERQDQTDTEPAHPARQKYQLVRVSGGVTDAVIKRGVTAVDFGTIGQGVVHLSALNERGGPYIRTETFESVDTVPQFTVRTQMGHLKDMAGYEEGDYGFITGNDLSLTPSTGFKGIVSLADEGVSLYNTDIVMREGSNDIIQIDTTHGISIEADSAEWTTADPRAIGWYNDLNDTGTFAAPLGQIGVWGISGDRYFEMSSFGSDRSRIHLHAVGESGTVQAANALLEIIAGGTEVSKIVMTSPNVQVFGNGSSFMVGATNPTHTPQSTIHSYEANSDIGESTGITIEQAAGGDVAIHWLLSQNPGAIMFSAGIDRTDLHWKLVHGGFLGGGDPGGSDVPYIDVDPTSGTVTIRGLVIPPGGEITGLTSSDASIVFSGSDLTVNAAMYVSTGRTITTAPGSGLTGGGALSTNLSLAVDPLQYVATGRSITAGAGLGGGGTLLNNIDLYVNAGAGISIISDAVALNLNYSPIWEGTHTFNSAPTINANLNFGGNYSILSTLSLTIAPQSGSLFLSPSTATVQAEGKPFKSANYSPSSANGIVGFEFANNGLGNMQLSVDTIKADELRATVFVADTTRVEVGDEWWGKSLGILWSDFMTPAATGLTSTIYFEDSPATSGPLFENNDWIMLRILSASGGATTMWGQVSGYVDQGYDDEGRGYQAWTYTHRSGSVSTRIKRGNVATSFGSSGQGFIHLSAIEQSNGPWIEMGEWVGSDPYTAANSAIHLKIGNLNGSLDYITDEWGFVTGNDISESPTTGDFSGLVVDATDGLKLYNTEIYTYDGGELAFALTPDEGLFFKHGDGGVFDTRKGIRWGTTIGSTSLAEIWATDMGAWNQLNIGVAAGTPGFIQIAADGGGAVSAYLTMSSIGTTAEMHLDTQRILLDAPDIRIFGGKVNVGSNSTYPAVSVLHVHENTATFGQETGVTISQHGGGDAVLHWHLSGSGKYFSAGIDNSDGDKFKISATSQLGSQDYIVIDPVSGTVTITGQTLGEAAVASLSGVDGINLSGSSIAVDASVVRTTRSITTGYGLEGGGYLASDLVLQINTEEVVTVNRSIIAGNGLSGGGTLIINRTLNVGQGDGISVTSDAVSVDSSVVRTTRQVIAGDGLVGGGSLTGNVTINVGAGDGIVVGASSIRVDDSVVRTTRNVIAGNGLSGGGLLSGDVTLTVNAGDGIQITGDAVAVSANVVRHSRIIATTGALSGGGDLSADRTLSLTLATNSGLNQTTGLALDSSIAGLGLTFAAGVLAVGEGEGITVAADSVTVKLPATSGLTKDGTGLYLADSVAGAGLTIASKVLAVGAGDGIDVSANAIAVNALAITDLSKGLFVTDNNIGIWLAAASGLSFYLTGQLQIDDSIAGSGLSIASKVLAVNVNEGIEIVSDTLRVDEDYAFDWTAAHTFASSVIVAGATTLNGAINLNSDPQIAGDIDFIGGHRSITTNAANNLTLSPGGALILNPSGLVLFPDDQGIRTTTFSDSPTGIVGFSFNDLGANYHQLVIGALKADEMYARAFVFDQVRIDRGEDFWSKSYGIVETTFIVPGIGGVVDVWFEDAPGLGLLPIFEGGDWILARGIDWASGTSMETEKIWFQVTLQGGETTYAEYDSANFRQRWHLTRMSGGVTGMEIKKGAVVLDVGVVGQGQIHLSALNQDGGPFLQVGKFSTVSANIPQFVNTVRMGNLINTVDYETETYGFVGGNNIGLHPSGGFSGFTIDTEIGLRLFDTEFFLYDGIVNIASFGETDGIVFKYSTDSGVLSAKRGISWTSATLPGSENLTFIEAWRNVAGNFLKLDTTNSEGDANIWLTATNTLDSKSGEILLTDDTFYLTIGASSAFIKATDNRRLLIGHDVITKDNPDSTLHIFEETTTNNAATGLTIQNRHSDGDALLHFVRSVTGSIPAWTMGADASNNNAFVLATADSIGTAEDVLTITQAGVFTLTGNVTITGTTTLSGNVTLANNMYLAADRISARDSGGLLLTDDTGILGIFINDSTGRVDIGEAAYGGTPHAYTKLLVQDNNDHAMITIGTPNNVNGYLYFADPESNTIGGIGYQHTDNSMFFRTNGATALTINSSGNVAIATTDFEAWNSSYRALQLGGGSAFMAGTSQSLFVIDGAYFDGTWKRKDAVTSPSVVTVAGGAMNFRHAATGAANSAITWTQPFTVTAGAQTVIGGATPYSSSVLTVDKASGDSVVATFVQGTAATYADASPNGMIVFNSEFTAIGAEWNNARIKWGYAANYAAGGSRLGFDVLDTGGNWKNLITLGGYNANSVSGRVAMGGAGLENPYSALNVLNNISVKGSLYTHHTDSNFDQYGTFIQYGSGGGNFGQTSYATEVYSYGGNMVVGAYTAHQIVFGTDNTYRGGFGSGGGFNTQISHATTPPLLLYQLGAGPAIYFSGAWSTAALGAYAGKIAVSIAGVGVRYIPVYL